MTIPYLGEKSKFSNFIIPNLPSDFSTYVEPFGGMFGIFFCLDISKLKNVKFVYNDINYLNYNLFLHLKNDGFLEFVDKYPVNDQIYNKSKVEIYKSNDFYKAFYWLVLLTCSLSQVDVMNGVWKGTYDMDILKMKLKNKKMHISNIHQILNKEYIDIIKEYDSKDTFFYIDPPYYGKEEYYINHTFTKEEHINLSELLKDIKGRFALSYLYFKDIDNWYKEFNIKKKKTLFGTECLIMNY